MLQATQLSGGSLGTMVLGLAASLLALAVFVQVVQEVYKYLTSSKSRAYAIVLRDFLGPWSATLLKEGHLNDLKIRGPLQLGSRSPRKWLLPMPAESLRAALEATATPWCQQVLQALNLEASLAAGGPPASPNWKDLLARLDAGATSDGPGSGTARELLTFIKRWTGDSDRQFDTNAMLTAFRAEFLPHVEAAVKGFPQLMQQFDFAYRRRNLRQTFILGFLVAFIGGFPIGLLYQRASRLTPEEARALAAAATSLADSVALRSQAAPIPDSSAVSDSISRVTAEQAYNDARHALALLRTEASGDALSFSALLGFGRLKWRDQLEYAVGCLVTALLLSFGAPFWNDLTKSLMKVQKQPDSPPVGGSGNPDT